MAETIGPFIREKIRRVLHKTRLKQYVNFPYKRHISSKIRRVLAKSRLILDSLRSKRFRLVSEQRKTEERYSIVGFGRARNETRAKKMKVGGGGREGRKRLQTNPSILKTCVRQRTQRLIGSASRTMLTCVDQRFVSY